MKRKSLIIRYVCSILAMLFLLSSCSDDVQQEYNSKYRCYFTFNSEFHPACDLVPCIAQQSMGTYCIVRRTTGEGATYNLNLTLFRKETTTEPIRTAEETRQQCIIGANNGLIIGRSALNNGELYAFDLMCPDCLERSKYKPLAFDTSSKVICNECKSTYSLDNNGFPISGTQQKLMRYHTNYNGKILVITN